MKTNHLVASVAALVALLLCIILWRQSDLSAEIDTLRAQLAGASRPQAPALADDGYVPPNVPYSPPEPGNSVGDLAQAEARIADLERVANSQADLIELLFSKLGGMEMSQQKANAPAWNALQVLGPPDSPAGDQRTAWAPASQDGGQEWLIVDFPKAVEAASVIVRENCAPGAIVRISAVTDSESEIPIWEGEAPKVEAVSDTPFAANRPILTNRVKIYLDTAKVPGWNEIDAVQLVGRDGTRQWASGARASSNYGSGTSGGLRLGGSDTDVFYNESLRRSNEPDPGIRFGATFETVEVVNVPRVNTAPQPPAPQ